MPVNEGLDELTTVQFIIIIRIVHLEVVKLELLLRHLRRVDGNVHMVLDMPGSGKENCEF
jgi:hypothetical protein